MDNIRTGRVIRQLRINSKLTQKQLADRIGVSDKAVSKWETGKGCPDVSLLTALADSFGTDVSTLLSGEIENNESENGNMKKTRFYVCSKCGNIVTAASEAAVTCCGSRLSPLEPAEADEANGLDVADIGSEWYITSRHEMTKEHHITFAAYQNDSCLMLFRQYPEWGVNIYLPMLRSGRLIWHCTKCGLFSQQLPVQEK